MVKPDIGTGLAQGFSYVIREGEVEQTLNHEVRTLLATAKEANRKIRKLKMILPDEKRVKRELIPLGGKILRYLFGTAVVSDLVTLNEKVDKLGQKEGELVHDLQHQVTLTREWDDKINTNFKRISNLLKAIRLGQEQDQWQNKVIRWTNERTGGQFESIIYGCSRTVT